MTTIKLCCAAQSAIRILITVPLKDHSLVPAQELRHNHEDEQQANAFHFVLPVDTKRGLLRWVSAIETSDGREESVC